MEIKLYIPIIRAITINKIVIIPPNEVVYLSSDLYLNEYDTPKESNFLRSSLRDFIYIYINIIFNIFF